MEKAWLARVDFLDHCDAPSEEAGVLPIFVHGLIVYEDAVEIHILKWCCDADPTNHNSEVWCIVKHPGIQIERIREESILSNIKD